MIPRAPISILAALLVAITSCANQPASTRGPASAAPHRDYVPSRGQWETRKPSDVGMDDALLNDAVEWARQQETDMPRDFSTQKEIFGRPLGPVPTTRALTNGIILRHGYIVAEWGEPGATSAVDPTYSVAKSYLSTILGLTIDRGLIRNVNNPVAQYIHDGGYDSPHNSRITWAHHATQTSEWEGVMFGKPHTFIGKEEFGRDERKPRDLKEPGEYYEYNDVRINRFSLSMLRLWKRPLPDVLKTELMDPIGASDTWRYLAYDNAIVDIEGTPMKSVSGGTRWGAGLWISTRDHARFGLLILRKGNWDGKQIISESWIHAATTQQGKNPGYGYLWWLNTNHAWPDATATSFAAVGAGNNTIWIDPEHDLVVVWRWHRGGGGPAEFYKRILQAIKTP